MNKVTMLPTGNDGSEPRRRLHLRDITNEVPVEEESVGADLRAARLRRGEDLRSIAQSLRIRRDQLEALEESRYDALPARAYAVEHFQLEGQADIVEAMYRTLAPAAGEAP